jgi:hypothetical protein
MGRKVDDEREARAFLKAAKVAGLTPGAWAREYGIDGRSLDAWRIKLAGAPSRVLARRPRLVELVAAPPVGTEPRYVVRVGEVTIEFGDDFRDESVVRLVRALRAC